MAAGGGSRLTAPEGRRFAWTLAFAFAALAGVERWRGRPTMSLAMLAIAVVWAVAGAVVPTHLGAVRRAWTRFGDALSWVTRPIVLAVMYWVVLTPIGLVRRTVARSPLARPHDARSYWIERPRASADDAARSMERMF